MLVKNQLVQVKWNNNTKEWYESKGYYFTHKFDTFYVRPEDLPSGSAKKIRVICDYCDKEYTTSYCVYYNGIIHGGKNACASCAAKKSRLLDSKKRKLNNYNRAKKICDQNGYQILFTPDDCSLVSNLIYYECPIHGVQSTTLDNFIHGHICYYCGRESTKDVLALSSSKIIQIIESKNNNKLLNPDDYINANEKNLKIKCGSCGKTFVQSLANYRRSNLTGKCPDCNGNSYGEYLIALCLDKYLIIYNRQFRFPDCKDQRALPFDFYLPDYNLVIEFDGKQHYKPIWGDESFKTTILHDTIKDLYCKRNNINMLRIPYWEIDNIENILVKKMDIDIN